MNVFLLLALLATTAAAQSGFKLLSALELEEIELRHDPTLLDVAAKPSETVNITLESSLAGAFVQERVDVNIDCFPWLTNFPGGQITWLRSRFGLTETGEIGDVEPPLEIVFLGQPRFNIGGDFDRWLNITSTVSIDTREEAADHGNYTCRVCIGQGTPLEDCHDSTLMLYLPGAPPVINKTDSNFPDSIGSGGELIYRIGADFCIERGTNVTFRIECDILEPDSAAGIAQAFPLPFRIWMKDGIVVYNTTDGLDPSGQINMEFYLAAMANRLLIPVLLQPEVFSPTIDGAITFQTRVDNSQLAGIPEDVAQDMLFDVFIGEWTCGVSNAYGLETATTNIRECGEPPVIKQCQESGTFIFPERDGVVSVACDVVCIREGNSIFLSCTVTAGTPPFRYTWFDGEGRVISNYPTLFVSTPGIYTCNAANRDVPENRQTSFVSFTLRQFFTGVVLDRFTNISRRDNGCARLSEEITVDACILVGETLNLTCISEIGTESDIFDLNMANQGGTFSITSTIDNVDDLNGTFQCSLSNIEGPCGSVRHPFSVQVFDPARINRVDDLGSPGALGVGRFNELQVVLPNTSVTLFCPTSGIPTPMDSWRRVTVSELGMAMEVVITGEEVGLSLSTPREGVLVLTIDNFSNGDEGTYVCRTRNVAGQDADTISITTRPLMNVWSTGEWTECDNPCAQAVRRRSVVCRRMRSGDKHGRLVADTACDLSDEPPLSETCEAIFFNTCLLDPVWIPYQWSPCSHGCQGGFRFRSVLCQVPMNFETRPDSDCSALIKPTSFNFCPYICCITDNFPTYCSEVGRFYCDQLSIQRDCCWSCGLTEIP